MVKLKKIIWAFRYKRAVKTADRMHSLDGRTYYVILWNGRMKVVPKWRMKQLVAQHRFRKGTTIRDIEKRALYIAG